MSRVDSLISTLCPNGVPMYSLGELGTTVSGLRGKSKEDFSDGNAPYVSYVEIFNNPSIDFVPEKRVKVADGENQSAIQLGDVLVTGSSETRNECGMTAVVTTQPDLPIYLNSFCFIWRPNTDVELDPQFAKHIFRGRAFRDRVIETANGVTRQNISKPKFLAIKVPLPPLQVQREIASILNKFTELEAVLEADLEARKIQSSYYKNILLRSDSVPTVQLGELVEVLDNLRKPVSRDKREAGEFPYYGANGIQGYVKDFIFDGTFLLMGEDGSVINPDKSPILHWVEGKIWVNNHAHILQEKSDRASLRYIYYALQMKDVSRLVRGMPPKINQGSMRGIEVALPSLEEQLSIVRMLDTFTELENQISKELTERRKQYEYYRSKLLGFKKLELA